MRSFLVLGLCAILAACSSASPTMDTPPGVAATPTGISTPTATAPPPTRQPTATFEPFKLPLSDYGPYFIGKRYYTFVDESRDDRQVRLSVWYPAIKPPQFSGTSLEDAQPDGAGAPYALILSSAKSAGFFASHFVTHGFVVIGIRDIDTYAYWNNEVIDQPLDYLYALDLAGSDSLPGLEGIIDVDRTGAMGYSFDGYNALALGGARIDPEHFIAGCSDPPADDAILFSYSGKWQCPLVDQWEAFSAQAGKPYTVSDDGLWQPISDPRIRAVMPLAPDGWLLYGQRGLAAVDRPMLILVGTKDVLFQEDELIFENLGSSERRMISFVGQNHMMIYAPTQVTHMKHFAAAFFGYYLQGNQAYADFISRDFVNGYPALLWKEP